MSTVDVVKTIAECVSTYKREFGPYEGRLSSFRSRARDLPTLVFTRGLAYSIVYIASRSSEATFRLGLEASDCSDLSKKVQEHVKNMADEESGYVLYGALLAFAMKTCGMNIKTAEDPLKELVEVSLKDPLVNARALEVAEWIKRFAEAYVTK